MFFRSIKRFKNWIAGVSIAGLLALCPVGPQARADDKGDIQELRQRLEALEKQNQELQRLIEMPTSVTQDRAGAVAADAAKDKASGTDAVKKVVDDYLKDKDKKKKEEDDKKKKEAEEKGTTVGDDTKLNVSFDNGGLRYKSADDAFNVHFGGRLIPSPKENRLQYR